MFRPSWSGWRATRQAYGEHRPFARFARHGHVAAHHAGELAREGKAEPRSAVAPRGQGIGMGEFLKKFRLLFGGQADERPTRRGGVGLRGDDPTPHFRDGKSNPHMLILCPAAAGLLACLFVLFWRVKREYLALRILKIWDDFSDWKHSRPGNISRALKANPRARKRTQHSSFRRKIFPNAATEG